MKKVTYFLFLLVVMTGIKVNAQAPAAFADIDIPYKKFVLDNGLTVIIHEDHKAPVVAVNIWYHVGSKNEKPGKTGFAHLFEHLMFNGSEHFNDDYFKALDKLGATDLNGTTSNDRTNYFQTVPVSAFENVLWLESDRMGYMVNAITQEKLDEQRGVVQNEKRQYENEPFGLVEEYMTKSVYSANHPYSWTVIGSMADLNAASLEDVKDWFKTYYGPNNATLVVAGDVNTNEALEKIKKYFGALPAGPPVVKYQQWPDKREGMQRQIMQDRVPQQRLYKVWNIPGDGGWEFKMLDIASDVLSVGKNSRFYKRLVYDDQIATKVSCYLDNREIGSLFIIEADVKPGVELSVVEKAINEELKKFLDNGPTEEELARVKTTSYAGFVRGLERVGGFGGKSDILASNQTYFGDPEYYKVAIKYLREAKVSDIKKVANDWLNDGQYVLEVHPFAEGKVSQQDADRSKMPDLGTAPTISFPEFQRAKLSNGLNIVLAQRKSLPIVTMALSFDAGYVSDKFSIPGISKLAMNMMDEGTANRSALKISEELDNLGTRMSTSSNLDQSFVSMNTLKQNLDPSLEIFADVLLNPSFPETDLNRLKKEQLVGIQREKTQPVSTALRILPRYLFGSEHPYGLPLTGSGFETTVQKISRDDIIKYYKTWIVPNNATLIVVGDITMDEIKPKIEKYLKNWKEGSVPKKSLPAVQLPSKPTIYLMDRPGSIQSLVFTGNVANPFGELNEAAISVMNNVIGGEFTARINMNIRENKHWSYGAGSFIYSTRSQRPFIVYTQVQSDKTKETVQEIYRELAEYLKSKPATQEEMTKNQNNELLQFAGKYETMGAVLGDINEIIKYNLKDDFYKEYSNKLKALQLKEVQTVAGQIIKPENLSWVIVGDKSKIEAPLKELGYQIRYINADGDLME